MATDNRQEFPRTEEVALLASEQRGVDQLAGTVLLDRYRLLEPLGEGGAAVVYRAEHSIMHKPFAVKILRPENAARPDFVRRFLSEARTVARLRHENIVDVVDIGRTESGVVFCVMEWLDGEELTQTIERDGPMPWARARHIAMQICRALIAAHEAGIVHRDIKPGNCLRVRRGADHDFIKVLDFGIAKDATAAHKLTVTGMVMGTAGYMPPEQARGLEVDPRADVYAVGAVLFELLSARPAFDGDGFIDVLMRQSAAPAPRVSTLATDVPRRVDDLVACTLERNRDDRFATMSDLANAIAGLGEHDVSEPASAAIRRGDDPLPEADTLIAPAAAAGSDVPLERPAEGGTVVAPAPFAPAGSGVPAVALAVGSWPPTTVETIATAYPGRAPPAPARSTGPRPLAPAPRRAVMLGILLGFAAIGLLVGIVVSLEKTDEDEVAADRALASGETRATTPGGADDDQSADKSPPDRRPVDPSNATTTAEQAAARAHPTTGDAATGDAATPENEEASPPVGSTGAAEPDVNPDAAPTATPSKPRKAARSSKGTARSAAIRKLRRRLQRACGSRVGHGTKTVRVDARLLTEIIVRIEPPHAPLQSCVEKHLGGLSTDFNESFKLQPQVDR